MKIPIILLAFVAVGSAAFANVAPTPVIVSATMRPNTTYMDVVYRANDPDDATVKVRALAFKDGVRSFANVLRPVTFVEGTASNIGDAITTNTEHTLTWDVGADWNVQLGQVKFEILAMDGRGLLAFDWISIPAAGGKPSLTISKDTPSDQAALDALFWLYAAGDPWLTLASGTLSGTPASGAYANVPLVSSNAVQRYGRPFLFKRMNLDSASTNEVNDAAISARANLINTTNWHAANRAYADRGGATRQVISWGSTNYGLTNIPAGLSNVTAIAVGSSHNLALKGDGTVVGWGNTYGGQTSIPSGLSNVTAIAAGYYHSLALKGDGTVVAWGSTNYGVTSSNTITNLITNSVITTNLITNAVITNGVTNGFITNYVVTTNSAITTNRVTNIVNTTNGVTNIPAGLSNVVAIAAGYYYSLALKGDGTVAAWGSTNYGQSFPYIPAGLSNVTAIAAGYRHAIALKSNGTVVCWGTTNYALTNIPAGLSNVTGIAIGYGHALALKSNGTVVCWGNTNYGLTNIPAGLSNVTAIAAGYYHNLALKSNGTVVCWGNTNYGLTNIPAGLSNVTAISAGNMGNLAIYNVNEKLP